MEYKCLDIINDQTLFLGNYANSEFQGKFTGKNTCFDTELPLFHPY